MNFRQITFSETRTALLSLTSSRISGSLLAPLSGNLSRKSRGNRRRLAALGEKEDAGVLPKPVPSRNKHSWRRADVLLRLRCTVVALDRVPHDHRARRPLPPDRKADQEHASDAGA